MKRGLTGRYEVATVGGEGIRAFIPRPLPPEPSLVLQGPIQPLLERALLALGRLDSALWHPAESNLVVGGRADVRLRFR